MYEGLIYIATGVVVVLVILIIMALTIGVIVRYDDFLRSRGRLKRAEASGESSQVPADVAAVIGLALDEHFAEQCARPGSASIEKPRLTTWSSSGRMAIMDQRRRVTSRMK